MKLILQVWPDGAWYASDDIPPAASSPIAKGTWSRTRDGKIVAESDGLFRSKAEHARHTALCQAVIGVVTAMQFGDRNG